MGCRKGLEDGWNPENKGFSRATKPPWCCQTPLQIQDDLRFLVFIVIFYPTNTSSLHGEFQALEPWNWTPTLCKSVISTVACGWTVVFEWWILLPGFHCNMWMYLKNSTPFYCVVFLRRWIIARRFLASLLWRSPSSLAFAIGCGAFAISESFSNPVALWVYQNGDRYLILPSPPVFPSFIWHPLDIPMFFG